jgi:dTDP-4-amino-4,6-dideoxygalactose transaminase
MPARLAPRTLEPAASPDVARIPVARAYMPQIGSVLPYLRQIDEARWYSNYGPLLRGFESRLTERFGTPTSIATLGSGTLALTIGLQALGCSAGGYCILPSWTFVATAHAVAQAGLRPWFVDVDAETWMLDPDAVRALLTEAPGPVHAVIPVAAFGRLPDLEAWARFRAETGLPVLLDAAAAFDALVEAPIPAMISLHATKILGVGEGGFVATRDQALATSIRKRSNFGFLGDRVAREVATNAKLSEYAAALGHAGLDHWSATRLRYMLSAQKLRIALIGAPDVRFQPGWGSEWVSTTCVVDLPEGAAGHVEAALAAAGVETRRWWGLGCHRAPAFAGAERTPLPVTERLGQSTIGLPFALDMEEAAVVRIAEALTSALASYARGRGG